MGSISTNFIQLFNCHDINLLFFVYLYIRQLKLQRLVNGETGVSHSVHFETSRHFSSIFVAMYEYVFDLMYIVHSILQNNLNFTNVTFETWRDVLAFFHKRDH